MSGTQPVFLYLSMQERQDFAFLLSLLSNLFYPIWTDTLGFKSRGVDFLLDIADVTAG